MDKQELDKNIYELEQAVISTRGNLIHRATQLESVIEIFIASYFVRDLTKLEEFHNLLLSKTAFENKRQIFVKLIEMHNKDFCVEFPTIEQDLKLIIETRNNLAHCYFDNSKEAIEEFRNYKTISVLKLRDSSRKIRFAKDELSLIIQSIYDYTENIKLILPRKWQ